MYDRFKNLCENEGKTMKEVCVDLGISQGTVSNWKKRNSTPSGDLLAKISKYFGVTMEYLLTGKDFMTVKASGWEAADQPPIDVELKPLMTVTTEWENGEDEPAPVSSRPLTDQERELLRIFRDMNREGRQKAMEYIKDLYDTGKYKKSVTKEQTA